MSLLTGNNSIDSLVYSSWNANAQTPAVLTYSFLSSPPADANADDRHGFTPMSAAQRQAVSAALQQWANVANVSFQQVSSGGNLQFGTNDQSADNSSAYAYLPGKWIDAVAMYLDNKSSYNTIFTPGSYGQNVVLHEIGHMLGLKHPGSYDSAGDPLGGAVLPKEFDNEDYSIMSYTAPTGVRYNGKYPVSPMLYDIQAVQYLYGANMSYRAGNDVYSFTSNEAPRSVWDAGGTNTFDFSSSVNKALINLNAGTFSETAPGLHNISIAYGVAVQRAVAGSGGSLIIGNDLGNNLQGGAGADQFELGKGNDVVSGADGSDTVVLHQAYAKYAVVRVGDSVTVIGEGVDTLQGVELLRFSDRRLALSDIAAAAVVSGGAGNDVLLAQAGNLKVDGGAGIDTLVFSGSGKSASVRTVAGAVVISDGANNDVLSGVERVQFSDWALALDTDGSAGQLYRLYGAMFARAPDEGGLGFWLQARDRGVSVESVANDFINSAEFIRLYGANLSNEAFVTQLYRNVLHREPDVSGYAFHLTDLQHGSSRAHVLVNFSESPEYIAALVGVMPSTLSYSPYTG
jgi:serralysin